MSLDTVERDIRILSILPGHFDVPIQCRLDTVSLDVFHTPDLSQRSDYVQPSSGSDSRLSWHSNEKDNISQDAPTTQIQDRCFCTAKVCQCYEALSYTWGSSSDGDAIIVDERRKPVTRNLFLALRRLRQKDKIRRLWVDALCIDQSNIPERNHQVGMMGQIYSFATDVIVWLGDTKELIDEGHQHYFEFSFADEMRPITRSEDDQVRKLGAAISNTNIPWWTRTWVVQEFSLARRLPKMQYSNIELSFLDFVNIADLLVRCATSEYAVLQVSKLLEFLMGFLATSAFNMRSFSDLAVVFATTATFDPRDRIYALLSVVSPSIARQIVPDYNKSVADVFVEATYAEISSLRSLLLLKLVRCRGKSGDMAHLPSWAVDFASLSEYDYRSIRSGWFGSSKWTHSSPGTLTPPTLGLDGCQLMLQGLVFGTVHTSVQLRWGAHTEHTMLSKAAFKRLRLILDQLHYRLEGMDHGDDDQMAFEMTDKGSFHVQRLIIAFTKQINKIWSSQIDANARVDLKHAIEAWILDGVEGEHTEDINVLLDSWWSYVRNFKGRPALFVTTSGFIGLAPGSVSTGDTIALVHGESFPVIVRPGAGCYTFQGFTFINGIMRDELMRQLLDVRLEAKEFWLR